MACIRLARWTVPYISAYGCCWQPCFSKNSKWSTTIHSIPLFFSIFLFFFIYWFCHNIDSSLGFIQWRVVSFSLFYFHPGILMFTLFHFFFFFFRLVWHRFISDHVNKRLAHHNLFPTLYTACSKATRKTDSDSDNYSDSDIIFNIWNTLEHAFTSSTSAVVHCTSMEHIAIERRARPHIERKINM